MSFLLEDIWELHSLALPPQLLAKWLQLPLADALFHHCRGRLGVLPCRDLLSFSLPWKPFTLKGSQERRWDAFSRVGRISKSSGNSGGKEAGDAGSDAGMIVVSSLNLDCRRVQRWNP